MISGDLLISLCGRSSRDVKLSPLQGEKKADEKTCISLKLGAEIVMEVIASDWIQ